MKDSNVKTILFQGDSITDVNRLRDDLSNLGQGYPNMVSGRLGLQNPGKYIFLNLFFFGCVNRRDWFYRLARRQYADVEPVTVMGDYENRQRTAV